MRFAVRSSVVAALLLIVAATLSAQATVSLGGAGTLTLKGFVSFTAFAQDQNFNFGNGQNAEYPTPPNCEVDCWFGGGDVRNTRLTLVFDGPKIGGNWKAGATVEMDFFGGFGASPNSAFIEAQPVPRLRLGYINITNGSTTIQLGQQWTPLFGNTAVSLSHIAFPLGYGSAGDIGWRFPGIFVFPEADVSKDSVGQRRSGRRDHVGILERPGLQHDEQLHQLPDGRKRDLAAVRAALQPRREAGQHGHVDQLHRRPRRREGPIRRRCLRAQRQADRIRRGDRREVPDRPGAHPGQRLHGPLHRPELRHDHAVRQDPGARRLGAARLRHHTELGHLRVLGHRRPEELRRLRSPPARTAA